MELLKLYRGINDHHMALYRDERSFYVTNTVSGQNLDQPQSKHVKAWMILDSFELSIHQFPNLRFKPVPLLVSRYEGQTRYFETPDDLQQFYSGLMDTAGLADLLRNNVPVIFGRLTVHREKPWHFNDGMVAQRYGKRSAM